MRAIVGPILFLGVCSLVLLLAMRHSSAGTAREERTYWDGAQTKLKTIARYDEQGRQHGDSERFSETGQRLWCATFEHGVPRLYQAWWENGARKYHQPFKDGLAEGEWIVWDDHGEVAATSNFNAGTGVEYYYQDNVLRTRIWREGKLVNSTTQLTGPSSAPS